jgi:hypothetical protein
MLAVMQPLERVLQAAHSSALDSVVLAPELAASSADWPVGEVMTL